MTQEEQPPESDPNYLKKLDEVVRRVQHEDTLMGNRLNWLLTSQTIFFATYAVLLYLNVSINQTEHKSIFYLIRWMAMGTCFLTYLSDLGAVFAIYAFCRWLNREFPRYKLYSQRRILGPRRTHFLGQASPILLPLGFIGVWLITLMNSVPWAMVIMGICLIVLFSVWILTFPYWRSPLLIRIGDRIEKLWATEY